VKRSDRLDFGQLAGTLRKNIINRKSTSVLAHLCGSWLLKQRAGLTMVPNRTQIVRKFVLGGYIYTHLDRVSLV
jgi:hypothetical protein